jgi:hypothetical protein
VAPSRERPSVTEDSIILALRSPIFIRGGVATIHKGFGHFEGTGGWEVL